MGRDTLAACCTSALAVVQLAGSTCDHCAAACTSSVEGRGPMTCPPISTTKPLRAKCPNACIAKGSDKFSKE